MNDKKGNFSFLSLLVTQFLGAFNDNAFKLVIAFFTIDKFAGEDGGALFLSLTGAVFIVPFLLFSTYAGFVADRFSKKRVIVWSKWLELIVMVLALFAFLNGNIWFILGVLFVMGTQSTLFSPAKYGILPEILSDEELSEGNGILSLWTYAAIILGQACGGFLTHIYKGDLYKTIFVFIGISIIGVLASYFIETVKPSGSKRKIRWNFLVEVWGNVADLQSYKAIWLSIVGLVYFGFLSGLFQLNILLYSENILKVNELHSSTLLVILAVGIGIGSMMAGKLSNKQVELGLVPFGAVGLSVFSILLGFISFSYLWVCVCLFLLGCSVGFFMIPLRTLIQQESPSDQLGRILATNNFLSFCAILLGSVSIYILKDVLHVNAANIFVLAGFFTIFSTIYIIRLLPFAFLRFIIFILTHTLYKIRIVNRDNIPDHGGALLVSNHVSYVDALLIVASTHRQVRFLVYRGIYEIWWLKPIFKMANVIPVSNKDSKEEIEKSLQDARDAIVGGDLVCIFAEGQLSRTGNMLKFHKGLERIMRGVDNPIIPVHLDRIWGSIFSFEGGKFFGKKPKQIPYPITVSFGKSIPGNSSSFFVRQKVMQLGAESFKYRLNDKGTLSESFFFEARRNPKRFCIADSSEKKLSYKDAFILSIIVSQRLKERLRSENNVGIMLTPSIAGSITNVAVSILSKIPVNINYTASKEAVASIFDQCDMKMCITSKTFLEKTNVAIPCEKIFIEDILESISNQEKIQMYLKAFCFPKSISHRLVFGSQKRSMESLATIMFTSGSTGEPKGVMLTHANIMSNLEGLYQVFHVQDNDKIMGVLPLFHSFGFTATLWFPLVSGIGAVYYGNPIDARTIGGLVQKFKATILMSTPTFLNAYIRKCSENQFASLRIAVVGAEKLKETTRTAFYEKYGIEPMEGYGCTELSPIVAMNLPNYREEGVFQRSYKQGKIGLPLPGIAVSILNQETMEPMKVNEDGLLFVKGPNVMKGYLSRPDLTDAVIQNGWYKTGDIANMDEEGFIAITDRLSRFSKIAGEMVPHIKVEEAIHYVLNQSKQICVVSSVADEKKGEKLVVLYVGNLDIEELLRKLKTQGLPNLWIPSKEMFMQIDKISMLGSGKTNLAEIKEIIKQQLVK